MKHFYSSFVCAALLHFTSCNGESAAVFAYADAVEGKETVAFVASEKTDIETVEDETEAVVIDGHAKEEFVEVAYLGETAPHSEEDEELSSDTEMTSEPTKTKAAESVEANTEHVETTADIVSSFAHMRERARGRIDNPNHPAPSFPRPSQQEQPFAAKTLPNHSSERSSSPSNRKPVQETADPARRRSVTDSFSRFLDALLSLTGVESNDGRHGQWMKDLKFLVNNVLMRANSLGDDPNAVQTQLNLSSLAGAGSMLENAKPHTWQLDMLNLTWIEDTLNKVVDLCNHLGDLVEQNRFHDAYQLVKDGDALFSHLQMVREYWQKAGPNTIPRELIIVIREYEQRLQELQNNAEMKTGIFEELIEGDSTSNSNPIAAAVSLIQKRAKLVNLLSAFETYALKSFSERLDVMNAALAGSSVASTEVTVSDFLSKNMPKTFIGFANEMNALKKVKSMIISLSDVCTAVATNGNAPTFCKSMAEALGAQDDVKEVPRRLQAYWMGNSHPTLSRVVESLPVGLQPQIDTVLARVPQLFPILAAATTNTVSALVDSSQEVANAMASTAQEVLSMADGNAEVQMPQFLQPALA